MEGNNTANFEAFTTVMFRVLLGCDAVQCSGRLPTFQRSLLPTSLP